MAKPKKQKRAKKQKYVPSPGPYLAIGLPYQRNFAKFADMVQETLNQAHSQDLSVECSTHPQGLLFVMRPRPQQTPVPLGVVLGKLVGGEGGQSGPRFSPAISEAMADLVDDLDPGMPDKFREGVQKRVAEGFFRRHSLDFLRQMEKELELEQAGHDERCDSPDCPVPKITEVVLESLKKHLSLSVS